MTAGFSHGMGRRLSVILAAFHEPEVLLLDEPFDGVDPIGVEATFEVVADARARGASVLLSTHLRELAIEVCTSALVLRGGRAGRDPGRRRAGRGGRRRCLPRSPRLSRPCPPAAPAPGRSTSSRPVVDTGHLLAFRAGSVRRPRVLRLGWGVLGAVTLAVVLVPALVAERGADPARVLDVLILLPTFMVGFLTLAVVSSVASGGGRELLAGEQAVAFPVSPTTDHLGALLMAPLNIAWLLQAWFLLGAASWATGLDRALVPLQVVLLLWLVLATAVGAGGRLDAGVRTPSAARDRGAPRPRAGGRRGAPSGCS